MSGPTGVLREADSFLRTLPEKDGRRFMPLGSIEVERLLTQTVSAEVYLGRHVGLDQPVQLRVMLAERQGEIRDPLAVWNSCRKTARVRHQNIVTIYDLGEYEGRPYIVMQYVTGVPFTERMKTRPYTEAEALKLLLPIADGLAMYWRHGLVHRGVSPRRINMASDGTPLLDVVVYPRETFEPALKASHAPYMAGFWRPEEIENGGAVDPRSDMFSFGATLFYALSDSTPFGMGAHEELLERGAQDEPFDARDLVPGLRAEMGACLKRCLQRDPRKRFATVQEFTSALQDLHRQITQPVLQPTQVLPGGGFGTLPLPAPAAEDGGSIGNCRLVKKVGSGSFGVVYRARHKTLDVDVAVKLLPQDLAAKDPTYVRMFLREARTAARIRHPNVIGIFEAGEERGQYYIVMEYAPNGSVFERMVLHAGKLSPKEAARVMLGAARGLSAAGKLNIIHRDIKPENLMFGADDEVKVADLGLAKRLPENPHGSVAASLKLDQITHANPSTIVGTPAYMAPETALDPANVDPRADLYSLGCTAYHMLVGHAPFEGSQMLQTIIKQVQQHAVPVHQLDAAVPEALSRVVQRCMEKNPGDRYRSAGELAHELEKMTY